MFLNESSLSKILALGGGLAGVTLAGSDFVNDIYQGENIDPISNPVTNAKNTIEAIVNATKIPFYSIGGATGGAIIGSSLDAFLNPQKKSSLKR